MILIPYLELQFKPRWKELVHSETSGRPPWLRLAYLIDSMNNHQPTRRRKPLRLKDYDYAREGAYFLTLVTANRKSLFGEINDGEMRQNELGLIVDSKWKKTCLIRPNVSLDEYIIMPNHLHGIIMINDRRGVLQYAVS